MRRSPSSIRAFGDSRSKHPTSADADYSFFVRLAWSYVPFLAVLFLLRRGLFESLARRERTAAEIAADFGWDVEATISVLDLMRCLGLLEQDDAGRFALTNRSTEWLLIDAPRWVGGFLFRSETLMNAYGDIEDVLRERRHSEMQFQTLASFGGRRDETLSFMGVMDVYARLNYGAIVDAGLLEGRIYRHVLDVGSGPATISRALLRDGKALRATLLDLPAVHRALGATFREPSLEPMVDVMAANWRRCRLRRSYDLVLLANVLHEEREPFANELVQKAANALLPDGEVWVVGYLAADDIASRITSAAFSLNMLFEMGTRNYDRAWVSAAFAHCGIVERCFLAVGGDRFLWVGGRAR